MGMVVNGQWSDDDQRALTTRDGRFVRTESVFRAAVTRDGASGFKAERGRYVLVTTPSCPWAHRAVLAHTLKRLDGIVAVHNSDLPKGQGWAYARGFDGLAPVDGVFHVHQVYTAARPDYTGRATVPLLWDTATRTIVNNESSEIVRMFDAAFADLTDSALDLYPEALRPEIDDINAFVYDAVNNGVYRCGFARSQAAYDEAFNRLFAGLDTLEQTLGLQRWLVGDRFTEADLRLFTTLVRFDAVYYGHFKCNLRPLAAYHHLSSYAREIYQLPGVAATVDFARIKEGYYQGMRHLNPSGIIPLGPAVDFSAPHDRARLPEAVPFAL